MKKPLLNLRSGLLVLTGLFFLSGCQSTQQPVIDYNSEINFINFKSFSIENDQAKSGVSENPVLKQKVEKIVIEQLNNKSLTFIENEADLIVKVAILEEIKANDSSFSIGLGTGSIGRSHSSSVSLGTTIPIENSIKIVHIVIDISHDKLPIWHGRDKYQADEDQSNIEEQQKLVATVNGLLAHFPPQEKTAK